MNDAGESSGTGLTNPDFVPFAESFGIDGYRPTAPAEVQDAFDEAVASDGMALVEVLVG